MTHEIAPLPMMTAVWLLAATAAQAAVSDFRQFAGQWRKAEHRDCKESLETNITIRSRMIIHQYGDIGVVLCDVQNVRPYKQQDDAQKGFSYLCRYTFAHGGRDAEMAFLFPLGRDKIELRSRGGITGVYIRCGGDRRKN